MIGVTEGVDNKVLIPISLPPAGFLILLPVGAGAVADRLIHYVPAIKHILIWTILAKEMIQHALYVPFLAGIHNLFGCIRLILVPVFVEKPLRRLGMPYKHMAPDLNCRLRILIIPVLYNSKYLLRKCKIHLRNLISAHYCSVCARPDNRFHLRRRVILIAEHSIHLQFIFKSHCIKMLFNQFHKCAVR